MSRNWSLALVVAFVLGFGVKSYLDGQNEVQEQHAAKQEFSATTLFGKDNQP
ncbi:SCO family protein, partial [Vibrio sp. 10N.222.54.A1]